MDEKSVYLERIDKNYIGPKIIRAYFKKEKDLRSLSKMFKPYNTRFIELDLDKSTLKYFSRDQYKNATGSYNLENLNSIEALECDENVKTPKGCPYRFTLNFAKKKLVLYCSSEFIFDLFKAGLSACKNLEKYPAEEFINLDKYYRKTEESKNNSENEISKEYSNNSQESKYMDINYNKNNNEDTNLYLRNKPSPIPILLINARKVPQNSYSFNKFMNNFQTLEYPRVKQNSNLAYKKDKENHEMIKKATNGNEDLDLSNEKRIEEYGNSNVIKNKFCKNRLEAHKLEWDIASGEIINEKSYFGIKNYNQVD